MTLQSTGPISFLDIQNEFGGTTPIVITEYYGATVGIPTSGEISLDDFYGTSAGVTMTVWIIAGGGAGSYGGGGAGGVVKLTNALVLNGSYPWSIGNAGAVVEGPVAAKGGNTTFMGYTALGGGYGGGYGYVATSGGSGGGGAPPNLAPTTPGAGTSGQGYAGGTSNQDNLGAGGGGAGGVGYNTTSTTVNTTDGEGGQGIVTDNYLTIARGGPRYGFRANNVYWHLYNTIGMGGGGPGGTPIDRCGTSGGIIVMYEGTTPRCTGGIVGHTIINGIDYIVHKITYAEAASGNFVVGTSSNLQYKSILNASFTAGAVTTGNSVSGETITRRGVSLARGIGAWNSSTIMDASTGLKLDGVYEYHDNKYGFQSLDIILSSTSTNPLIDSIINTKALFSDTIAPQRCPNYILARLEVNGHTYDVSSFIVIDETATYPNMVRFACSTINSPWPGLVDGLTYTLNLYI